MIKGLLQKFRKPQGRLPAQRMLTLHSAPVYYLPITKVGSTYLKNLFYYLDHGEEHVAGVDIHSNPDDLVRAKIGDANSIRQSPYAFAVLRDPVDRFLSLYFDKIYGEGQNNFPKIRKFLALEIGLDLTPNLEASEHRENCNRLIDWFALNLAHKTEMPVNHHWRRQSSRLDRVETLQLKHLTLEGLVWQLPLLLADIVPNIQQAMTAVKSDNRTSKPFSRGEILDAALLAKIEDLYSKDKELYEKASLNWQPWLEYYPNVDEKSMLRCFTANDFPINCIVTSKVGRTYVRNLLHTLDHGSEFSEPLKIHNKVAGPSVDLTKAELANETSFFVVRDPVNRLFSLYFDKILGTGEHAFPWITKQLIEHRDFVHGDNLSIEQHRNNCIGLLEFLKRKFKTEPLEDLNPHWSPQVEMAKKAIRFGLQPLLLENLDEQLLHIAKGRIEGLENAMKATTHLNRSSKPYSAEEILTPEIAQRISDLYGDDQALYERVKTAWDTTGRPPIL